jgi:hypothetical protein
VDGHGGEGERARLKADRSLGTALLPRPRDGILGGGYCYNQIAFFRNGGRYQAPLPHIAQHLDVAGDLFPRPLYASLLEIINEELVPPP